MKIEEKVKTDFSDWLVASDIDGTLNNKLRRLPKRNYDRICEFVLEKKGHFTLASGRNVSSMRKPFQSLPIQSTPAIILNGAGLYDYEHEKMLRFHPINPAGYELVKAVMKKFPAVEVEILTSDSAYTINAHIFANVMLKADNLPHRRYKKADEVPPDDWGKVIFLGMPPLVSAVKRYLLSIKDPNVNFMSSSISSFEMLEKGIHKGVGVREVAELYGIDYKHTAAIGDYFNDYELLKSVYLPACCGQAPRKMHEIAKFHACHCNHGAVADLLEYIMYEYKED
ncbi:MAG TPA: HAD family phosphatase [Candidatus Fimenecus excrementavium]|nr:HAD family phosphatase [Candidatus Fimenecus excrementavium]